MYEQNSFSYFYKN